MPIENNVFPTIVNNRPDLAERDFTYRTYSGADITAQILLPFERTPLILGDIQTLSYSIHRETKPVRLIGHSNISGVTRGSRTIAGSLVFVNFEAYTFYRLETYKQLVYGSPELGLSSIYPLADMLPPFDILLTFSNEYGSFSRMKILGVTIMDEGATMSIEDLVTESQYTYIARGIEPMTRIEPFSNVSRNEDGQSGRLPIDQQILGGSNVLPETF